MNPLAKPMIKALNESEKYVERYLRQIEASEYIYCQQMIYRADLKTMFKNYFSGEPIFKFVSSNKVNQKILEINFDYYLKFYTMIHFGWAEIKENFRDIEPNFKKPGEVLIYVLTEEAKNSITDKKLAKPQTLYRGYKAYTAKNIEGINKWGKKIKKQTGVDFEDISEVTKLIELCTNICESSKNRVVSKNAAIFKDAEDELCNTISSLLRKQF